MRPQRARVVRDEVLSTLDDPGKVTDAQLVRVEQCRSKRQPGRIGKRVRLPCRRLRHGRVETPDPQSLGRREVETQKIAAIVGHDHILTFIGVMTWRTLGERACQPQAVVRPLSAVGRIVADDQRAHRGSGDTLLGQRVDQRGR